MVFTRSGYALLFVSPFSASRLVMAQEDDRSGQDLRIRSAASAVCPCLSKMRTSKLLRLAVLLVCGSVCVCEWLSLMFQTPPVTW